MEIIRKKEEENRQRLEEEKLLYIKSLGTNDFDENFEGNNNNFEKNKKNKKRNRKFSENDSDDEFSEERYNPTKI